MLGVFLFLFLMGKDGFCDVTFERIDPNIPAPKMKNLAEPNLEVRDPTASERNSMLAEANLLDFVKSFDEVEKDLFLHRLVDWDLQQVNAKYPKVTEKQQEKLKKSYEKFRKNLH